MGGARKIARRATRVVVAERAAGEHGRGPEPCRSSDTSTDEFLSVAHDAQHDRDHVGADYEGAIVPLMEGFVFDTVPYRRREVASYAVGLVTAT